MALLRRPARWLGEVPWLLLRLGRAGGGHAFGTLSVWYWYERLTMRLWHVRPIRPGGMLMVSESRHHGPPVSLEDGTVIHDGDGVIELHMDNDFIGRGLAADKLTPWRVLRTMNADLRALAALVASGEFPDARAVHGVSLFAAGGARIGMELRDLPDTAYWHLVRYFMIGLLALHHPNGWSRVGHMRRTAWPQEVWESRAALLTRVAAGR
ncbi:MAG TPA: hypothetical protein VFN57_16435 [Thermomicrobiaceae bacterium]|nr:hypothetical protein [Thermomicrobiaceae bacterium]